MLGPIETPMIEPAIPAVGMRSSTTVEFYATLGGKCLNQASLVNLVAKRMPRYVENDQIVVHPTMGPRLEK